MVIEGFSSGKWTGPVRQQPSKRGSLGDSKRSQEGKLSQSTIFLHDWWLVKADPDSHGKQLGIGGSTWKGNQGIRCFSSASICKRHDAVTLQTVDGVTVMVQGYLNRSRTLENGFSEEVCDHFLIGFPYYWEEYAVLSVSEEPGPPYNSSDSKGVSHPSDACKTPAHEDCAAVSASEKAGNFSASKGASPSDAYKIPAQETRANLAGGPLTRSRARLLATTTRLGR